MYNIERKSEIINLLESQGSVNVADLAIRFKTSKETVRRDLRELKDAGALKRTHGGAIPAEVKDASDNSSVPTEYPVSIRGIRNFQKKQAICKKAASYIKPGDTIFVDNSSTMIYLSQYIPADMPATFITNSIQFLLESSKENHPNQLFILLGGVFKSSNLSLSGNTTLHQAKQYYPNKSFLSCTGLSAKRMITDSSIQEVDTKRLMIELSKEVFILADHSKFEKDGQIFLSSFDNISHIITDSTTDITQFSYLSKYNIDLIIAEDS